MKKYLVRWTNKRFSIDININGKIDTLVSNLSFPHSNERELNVWLTEFISQWISENKFEEKLKEKYNIQYGIWESDFEDWLFLEPEEEKTFNKTTTEMFLEAVNLTLIDWVKHKTASYVGFNKENAKWYSFDFLLDKNWKLNNPNKREIDENAWNFWNSELYNYFNSSNQKWFSISENKGTNFFNNLFWNGCLKNYSITEFLLVPPEVMANYAELVFKNLNEESLISGVEFLKWIAEWVSQLENETLLKFYSMFNERLRKKKENFLYVFDKNTSPYIKEKLFLEIKYSNDDNSYGNYGIFVHFFIFSYLIKKGVLPKQTPQKFNLGTILAHLQQFKRIKRMFYSFPFDFGDWLEAVYEENSSYLKDLINILILKKDEIFVFKDTITVNQIKQAIQYIVYDKKQKWKGNIDALWIFYQHLLKEAWYLDEVYFSDETLSKTIEFYKEKFEKSPFIYPLEFLKSTIWNDLVNPITQKISDPFWVKPNSTLAFQVLNNELNKWINSQIVEVYKILWFNFLDCVVSFSKINFWILKFNKENLQEMTDLENPEIAEQLNLWTISERQKTKFWIYSQQDLEEFLESLQ